MSDTLLSIGRRQWKAAARAATLATWEASRVELRRSLGRADKVGAQELLWACRAANVIDDNERSRLAEYIARGDDVTDVIAW